MKWLLCLLPLIGLAQPDSIEYYVKKGDRYRFSGNDSLLYAARQLYQYGTRKNNRVAVGRSLQMQGVYWHEVGDYEKSLRLHDSSLLLMRQWGDSASVGRVYHHLGVVHRDLGQFEQSYHFNLRAIELLPPSSEESITSIMSLAILLNQMGRPAEAMSYAKRALSQSPEGSHVFAGAAIEVGTAFMATNQLDSAIVYFERAKASTSAQKRDAYYIACNNLGVLWYYKNDYQKAISNFNLTLVAASAANDLKNQAMALVNLGDTYTAMNQFEKAREHLDKGIALSKKVGNKRLTRDGYDYLVSLATRQNDWKAAFDFSKVRQAYHDSLLNEATAKKIAELQTRFETREKEAAIVNLHKDLYIRKIELIGLAVVAVLLVGVVWLIYNKRALTLRTQLQEERQRAQKERFRVILETEEKEKSRLARELHDGLGQMLLTARLLVSDMDETNTDPKVVRTLGVLDTTIQEVRQLSHSMIPYKLSTAGLLVALNDMAETVSSTNKIAMEIEQPTDLNVDTIMASLIYRSVQEVTNNAIRYSGCNQIRVRLRQSGNELEVVIADNGRGFDQRLIENSKGIGWANLKTRIDLAGGKIEVHSAPGQGTQVILTVPRNDTLTQ